MGATYSQLLYCVYGKLDCTFWTLSAQLENSLNFNEIPDIRLVKILMDMVIILLHNFVGLLCYLIDLYDFDE